MRRRSAKPGFTLLDVMLATVILTVGTMFCGKYFADVYDELSPHATGSGLRRFLLAEQMLKAQAEALRTMQVIPADAGACRMITPPVLSSPNVSFTLGINQYNGPNSPDSNNDQLYYFDLSILQGTQTVWTLTMSTLRYTVVTQDAKIGL